MTTVAVSCPFEDCRHFGQIVYVELSRYKRHLAVDHDRYELRQLAFRKGIIQDSIRYHNDSYIIQKIAEISKINGDLYHGSN
jgi:hypothetical protein